VDIDAMPVTLKTIKYLVLINKNNFNTVNDRALVAFLTCCQKGNQKIIKQLKLKILHNFAISILQLSNSYREPQLGDGSRTHIHSNYETWQVFRRSHGSRRLLF